MHGTNRTADVGAEVTLDGRGSRDPNGSISSYSWIQTSGPAVTLNNADTSTPTFTAPNVSADSMLQFLLTVKDNRGATSNNSAIVSVTVKAPVQKPSMVVAPINTTAPAQPTGNVTAPPTSNVTAPPTSNVGWMLGQGKVAFDQGNYAEAIQYLDQVLAIDPNNIGALNSKGLVLNTEGNYAEAIQYLDQVLAIDPNHVYALTNKAWALNGLGNYAQAIEYSDKALGYRS